MTRNYNIPLPPPPRPQQVRHPQMAPVATASEVFIRPFSRGAYCGTTFVDANGITRTCTRSRLRAAKTCELHADPHDPPASSAQIAIEALLGAPPTPAIRERIHDFLGQMDPNDLTFILKLSQLRLVALMAQRAEGYLLDSEFNAEQDRITKQIHRMTMDHASLRATNIELSRLNFNPADAKLAYNPFKVLQNREKDPAGVLLETRQAEQAEALNVIEGELKT